MPTTMYGADSSAYCTASYYSQSQQISKWCGFNAWFFFACSQLACITVFTVLDMKTLVDLNAFMTASFVINITILIICVVSLTFLVYGIFWRKQNQANEICFFLLANSLSTFYISLEFAFQEFAFTTASFGSTVKLIRLCSSLSLTSILLVTSSSVIISSEYSIIGVAPTLLSMYKQQCGFLSILKFDFLCSATFALFNIGVSDKDPMLLYLACSTFFAVSTLHWLSGRYAVIKELKACILLFVITSTISLLWVPLQFVFLETCFTLACSNQKLLLSYGLLVSSVILIVVRIWLFMHLLKVYKNFGYGLADSAFIGLATETTRLLTRSPHYRQRLEL